MDIEVIDLDLALDELALFENAALVLQWHEMLSIWFAGEVSVVPFVS